MHILIVSQYFHPERFRVNDLALGLKERGHRVTVLTGLPNYPEGEFFEGYGFAGPYQENWNDIKIVRVPLISRGSRRGFRLILNYLSFALLGCFLGPLKCRDRYDGIFVYEVSPVTVGLPAIAVKFARRSKILFWVGDLWPDTLVATGVIRSKPILAAVGLLVRFIYRFSDRILLSTQGFVPKVEEQKVPRSKITVWPQWAEKIYERRHFSTEELPSAEMPKGFTIMFAGNFGTSQGFETILEAWDQLRAHQDIHLVLLGDGFMKEWICATVAERDLTRTVHMLGSHPVERMPAYFHLADALLVSLRADPLFALTMPGKMASYLASAKPVLACLEGEGKKVIEESQCGYCSAPGDSARLAENVLRLFNAPSEERQHMGMRGYQYYLKYFERDRLLTDLEEMFVSENTEYRQN